jgi:hypothetical protein
MKRFVCAAVVVSLCLMSGCGSSLPTLAGQWVFTLTPSDAPSAVTHATATLTQLSNNSLFGQVYLTGSGTACGPQAEITGIVSGSDLTFHLTQSQNTLTLKGTATGGVTLTATGTYTANSGPCIQDGGSGTWTAFLASSTQ